MCTRCSSPATRASTEGRRLATPPVASVSTSGSARAASYVDSIEEAAEALRTGRLVAFPTETVYGLGAHAFDEAAVLAIFAAKGRPRTDPLIVHVADGAAAEELLSLEPAETQLLRRLAADFWPGPLTLVAPACAALPGAVTGGGGSVGVRCPDHGRALALLQAAHVPVAAPSANRFGHVSPTRAEHVMADLGASDLLILTAADGSCKVGIESTVVKLERGSSELVLLRRGGVPEAHLSDWLRVHGDGFGLRQKGGRPGATSVPKPTAKPGAQEAPGMRLTHYAPDLPSYLARMGGEKKTPAEGAPVLPLPQLLTQVVQVEDAVVLDFGGRAAALRERASAYRDLSPAADAAAAAAELFDGLRWAEACAADGAQLVLLPELHTDDAASNGVVLPALADRLFRAASGRAVEVKP